MKSSHGFYCKIPPILYTFPIQQKLQAKGKERGKRA
jgi:hypothetical protein